MIAKPSKNGHTANGISDQRTFSAAKATASEAAKAPSQTEPNGKEGRTPNGRFAQGNRIGKGNPFARKLGKMRSAFLKAVTETDVAEVALKLKDLAINGDLVAAQLFLAYAVGRPTNAVDPDRLDLDELRLLAEAPTMEALCDNLMGHVKPSFAAELAQGSIKDDHEAIDKWIQDQKKELIKRMPLECIGDLDNDELDDLIDDLDDDETDE